MKPSMRPDIHLLAKLVESKSISDAYARECASLPIFPLTVPEVRFDTDGGTPRPVKAGDEWHCWYADYCQQPSPFLKETFPFTDFMVIASVYDESIANNKPFLARIRVLTDTTFELMCSDLTATTWITCHIGVVPPEELPEQKARSIVDIDDVDMVSGALDVANLKVKLLQHKLPQAEREYLTNLANERIKTIDMYVAFGGLVLKTFKAWVEYNNQHDRYLTTVNPVKLPKFDFTSRKGRLAKVAGPKLVYLDKLPHTGPHVSATTGEGRAPHHRKGHFRTLSAERYRDHPLYLKEKAIYVKPAFIGERTTEYEGQIYTVVDK